MTACNKNFVGSMIEGPPYVCSDMNPFVIVDSCQLGAERTEVTERLSENEDGHPSNVIISTYKQSCLPRVEVGIVNPYISQYSHIMESDINMENPNTQVTLQYCRFEFCQSVLRQLM